MRYIVEFIEEDTHRFRAVYVNCDNDSFIDVDLMKCGYRFLKILKHYPAPAEAVREVSSGL